MDTPRFIYGTAWKEERTQSLTELAIERGFRAIDTANQRKHYFEEAVGNAIRASIGNGIVTREDLFLQTKFTFRRDQDQRIPYDPAWPIPVQVEQSFASSLDHLSVDFLDSYVLHGPTRLYGLGPNDWSAWRAMESLYGNGKVKALGISNVYIDQLKLLCDQVAVRPAFVQNRCFANQGWDREVREFCAANGIVYQGFSLLTANRQIWRHPVVREIAHKHERTPAQILFRFAVQIGILPLTGTTDAEHMDRDLAVFEFDLDSEERNRIKKLS